jgi:pimeloyl-ACP methyl ester carboxylesterase
VLDLLRFCIRDVTLGSARSAVALALAHDTRAELGRITAPVRLVVGERESVFYRDAYDELLRLMPHATGAVSPGASHLHLLSNAEWLAGEIADWMRERVARV